MPPRTISAPTTAVDRSWLMSENRSWNCGNQAPTPDTVNISALTPTSA